VGFLPELHLTMSRVSKIDYRDYRRSDGVRCWFRARAKPTPAYRKARDRFARLKDGRPTYQTVPLGFCSYYLTEFPGMRSDLRALLGGSKVIRP
jgi:hypothetical protein